MNNQITSIKGYTSQIGILVCEMNLVREHTFKLTKELSLEALDFNFDAKSNSIGTLLLHIAALEFKFQLDHFHNRNITESEFMKYGKASPYNLHNRLVYGNDLEYYFNTLEEVRAQTLEALETVSDDWLYEDVFTSNGTMLGNRYYLLKHIIHDELCHQGQIKLILKRLNVK